jgi:Beta-propeller repeat
MSMSTTDARPGAFTKDNSGNFYVLADSGFSVNLFKYTLVPFKYGERLRLLWSKTVSGPWVPDLGDVVTDGNGNVYISYSFHSPDGNKATPFLTKFNTNGDILFTRDLSPNNAAVQYTYARRLSVSADAVYVSGNTSAAYPGYTNQGSDDVFVLKYNSSGTRLWVRQFGTNSHDWAYGLAVSGRVFVAGYTNGRPNLLGQGTPGTFNDDAFVRSLNVNTGSVVWTGQ